MGFFYRLQSFPFQTCFSGNMGRGTGKDDMNRMFENIVEKGENVSTK